jgi:hypothetical protein
VYGWEDEVSAVAVPRSVAGLLSAVIEAIFLSAERIFGFGVVVGKRQ